MNWRAGNSPDLIVGAIVLALDDKLFCNSQQCQKQVNVRSIVSQMADIDECGACLGGALPKNVAITRIARCGSSVRHIKKQAG
jgi:hypothetical protein